MCEMSCLVTIVGMGTNTESVEVVRPPLRIVANRCCLNPFLLADELLNYQPEVVVAIKEDHTLRTCMIKRLGPSTQFYRSADELLTALNYVDTFTAKLYFGFWNDGRSSWNIRTNDKSDMVNNFLMAQLRMIISFSTKREFDWD